MISGSDLGAKLCEVLGIDPNVTVSLSIDCIVGESADIRVRQLAKDGDDIVNLFRTFRIEEV